MNTIVQILSTESVNTSNIYLYREGIFYKAYERSAYAFVTGVQKFMVKKKFVKCANQEVVSIGFPCDGLYKHFTKEQVIEKDNGIQVKLEQQIDVTAFEQWKHSIMLTVEKPKQALSPIPLSSPLYVSDNVSSCTLSVQDLLLKIRMFPIEIKTPMECMLFLSEIKRLV
ncbi:hypothetical protein [Bacteroides ovatus]|jgi:hypothetical protein|uniref:hypothetical protein n=1 Tax=Bacteroides ovatus TaxID=28116 RepID=UPI0022E0AA92|nr:hypothetical protein [Bacteroides ovatus]UYI64353.1 MAG: hypothetical protein OGM04_02740 [Bacteroides ovatus]